MPCSPVDILQGCITFTVSSHVVYTLTLRKMVISSSETSVPFARTTWQYSLEARTLHILHSHHYENLNSKKQFNMWPKIGEGEVKVVKYGTRITYNVCCLEDYWSPRLYTKIRNYLFIGSHYPNRVVYLHTFILFNFS
jgi:hypothetical protein